MIWNLANIFPATVVARRIGSVFDFATRILNSRPEILNKLLAAISVVHDVSLALVNHGFHILYASSSNTDQWVDVGLSGKLDRKDPADPAAPYMITGTCCSHRS